MSQLIGDPAATLALICIAVVFVVFVRWVAQRASHRSQDR